MVQRLYVQGVVARAYSLPNKMGEYQLTHIYRRGLRPKVVIGCGRMAVRGFNVRGVSIAMCIDPSEVEAKLEEVANESIDAGGKLGERQQVLDTYVMEEKDAN